MCANILTGRLSKKDDDDKDGVHHLVHPARRVGREKPSAAGCWQR